MAQTKTFQPAGSGKFPLPGSLRGSRDKNATRTGRQECLGHIKNETAVGHGFAILDVADRKKKNRNLSAENCDRCSMNIFRVIQPPKPLKMQSIAKQQFVSQELESDERNLRRNVPPAAIASTPQPITQPVNGTSGTGVV